MCLTPFISSRSKDAIEKLKTEILKVKKVIQIAVSQLAELDEKITKLTSTGSSSVNTFLDPCSNSISNSMAPNCSSSITRVPASNNSISTTSIYNSNSISSYCSPNLIIPQLDGNFHPPDTTQTSHCETCYKVFANTSDLEQHNKENQFCCDECNICYKTEIDADFHELEEHPDAGHPDDIPAATRLLFTSQKLRN